MEETGCHAVLEKYAGCTTYLVQGVPKVVLFWNMRAQGEGTFRPNKEVDKVAWLCVGAMQPGQGQVYGEPKGYRQHRPALERNWLSRLGDAAGMKGLRGPGRFAGCIAST